jgi:DNA-binding NtrC family response regulator
MVQLTEHSMESGEPLSGMRKVLIFDQDAEDLVRHAEPFEARGFDVCKCMSIETAMRSIEKEEFDVVLVDQVSKAFEGLRVLRHLVRYNIHTPFVVLAGCKDARCSQQAFALGAMDYLEKPVSSAAINSIIQKCFADWRQGH